MTTAYTERQKVERAFAAELLSVSPEIAIQDDLDGIAAHFQVSPMVIKHQLDNQLLAI